jgi:hypothetical protein
MRSFNYKDIIMETEDMVCIPCNGECGNKGLHTQDWIPKEKLTITIGD